MTVAIHAARRTGAGPKPQKRHACVPCSERGLDACPHFTNGSVHRHASSFDDAGCLSFLRGIAVDIPTTASEMSRHKRAVFGGHVAAAYLTRPILSQRDGVTMTFEPAEAAWPVVAIMNELVADRPRDYSLQWLRLAIVLTQSAAQIARSFRKSESDVTRGLNGAAIRVCRDDLPIRWVRDRDAIRLSPAKCNCRRAQRGGDCGHATDRVVAEGGRTPAHWRWYYGDRRATA